MDMCYNYMYIWVHDVDTRDSMFTKHTGVVSRAYGGGGFRRLRDRLMGDEHYELARVQ